MSAIIGREAYDLAGDSVRFPAKSTQGLAPWTVSKFYRDRTYWGPPYSYSFDAGEYNPLLGESYAEIAMESRSQHRSQGTGALPRKGPSPGYLMREATRVNAGDGLDEGDRGSSTGSTRRGRGMAPALAHSRRIAIRSRGVSRRCARRYRSVGAGSNVDQDLRALLAPAMVAGQRADARARSSSSSRSSASVRVLRCCSRNGVAVEATVDRDLVAIGDTIQAVVSIYNRGQEEIAIGDSSFVIVGSALATSRRARPLREVSVAPGAVFRDTVMLVGMMPTQPWWLARGTQRRPVRRRRSRGSRRIDA